MVCKGAEVNCRFLASAPVHWPQDLAAGFRGDINGTRQHRGDRD
jgi:hypothetical protein